MRSQVASELCGNGFIEKHPDMRSIAGARTFHNDRQSDPLTSIAHGLHILMPILLVQINCQAPTALICEQWINAGDESIPMRILSRKMPSDDVVGDRQKPLMQAFT